MARFGSLVLIFLVIFSASFLPQMESRKLLNAGESIQKSNAPSNLFASLVLSALPKGTVPAKSAPSKKGHATLDNEKLFARHLAGIGRILKSSPSPGAGN
ncbi:hypothetical protein PTKIN_Ptkin18bG0107100 [Pterospermum kingtungense]